jgi:Ferritin-like
MIRIRRDVSDLLEARDVGAVTATLQVALELEFATIPPYLYAMWSLDPNDPVAAIIKSVISEEMRHLAMVANIINALGGTPVIASPDHIPRYPSVLPGSVETGVKVGLAPFSTELVQNIFMVIEQPEHPLQFHVAAAPAAAEPKTIGEFYGDILNTIIGLGDGAFTGPPGNQVGLHGAVKVSNVASAKQAIDTIVDQGEGTSKSPIESAGNALPGTQFAHFYRFQQIVKQHLLSPHPDPSAPPDQQFKFDGPDLPVPTAVFDLPVNPAAASYPDGSDARKACDDFNASYTSMLKTLQTVFTGQPGQLFTAVSAMNTLDDMAETMVAMTPPVGPTFEWREA